ncbi:hypothetical protein ACFFGR_19355 [Arthrobacter liuii]|uniref:Uncharacterized protein n=1 Tax=Arthrobacter liuii TaxID=1476996 RepID=A0ABQ2AGZ5_9MICC|nr:hypothetical protein [Arthrobacter liuii]GGH91131.1 hypothetical protein GCM10007170_06560 [Arthrobacter liuii]
MGAGRNHAGGASALLVLLLSSLFVGVPAAHAAFTASGQSGFRVSALVLQPPVASITASCAGGGSGKGKNRLNIAVSSVGSVPRANAYVLIVTDPSGTSYTVDPASSGYSNQSPALGTWKYYVQAQYRVPGTTNVWKSNTANPLTVVC